MTSSKKTVLITGTNPGGIGNSLARAFHSAGLRVFATARNTQAISDLAELGIETIALEVTDESSIIAARDAVREKTSGRLDYLVNNAGRNYTMPAMDLDLAEVRAMYEVNVFGVMRICQVFVPLLMETKGTIVQIGSVAGIIPFAFGSSYNASKAALHSYSDSLRLELMPFGVNVITVITGGVKSRITRNHYDLRDDSLYKPLEAEYNRRQGYSQEVGIPNEKYAASVVAQVLRGRPRTIWEGGSSWLTWFATRFLPYSVLESFMWRAFKLWKLKGTFKAGKASGNINK